MSVHNIHVYVCEFICVGSPLDVGFYHNKIDSNRNVLTMEMWIRRRNSSFNTSSSFAVSKYFDSILLMRCFGTPYGSVHSHNGEEDTISGEIKLKSIPLWLLHTDGQKLKFTVIDPTSTPSSHYTPVQWLNGVIIGAQTLEAIITPNNDLNAADEDTAANNRSHVNNSSVHESDHDNGTGSGSDWFHVAVTVDSTSCTHAKIAIIVEGTCLVKSVLPLPNLTAALIQTELKLTTLYLCPYLSKGVQWSLTELRFHVDIKNEEEINMARYNYLGESI